MSGPDGWRRALVKWEKGTHPSRKIHYFRNGNSLCGRHYDGMTGWFIESKKEFSNFEEMNKCKGCKKVLEKEQNV